MAEGRVRGFSIATKCATVDELIEKFRDRVDDQSILINEVESREIGTECAFAILLADKKVALAGTCTVMAVFTDANNPFMRPGMRLGIKRLGPESERVFADLLAKRIPPRRATMALPVVASLPPRTNPGRATPQPVRMMRAGSEIVEIARELPDPASHLQLPVRDSEPNLDEPPTRVPRATPRTLDGQRPAQISGGLADARAPGSSLILPANPLMNLTDASLEGFVDCKIGEAVPPPPAFPIGTRDELQTVTPSAPMPVVPAAAAVPTYVEPMRSEPMALPPPPTPTRPSAPVPVPVPYQSTELPKLAVETNDAVANVRIPLVSRRLRNQLLLAVLLVPLLGAGAVVGYMHVAKTAVDAPPTMPAALAIIDDEPVQLRAAVEPAPEPAEHVPARPQPIHAVLVRSYPQAARVTVGDRYFGTTPTYVKVPANTPVEVNIVRRGFKPVMYPLVSKNRTDRVFVRLQRVPKPRQ